MVPENTPSKLPYEKPTIGVLGQMEELTGSGGNNNDDGWYWSRKP